MRIEDTKKYRKKKINKKKKKFLQAKRDVGMIWAISYIAPIVTNSI